MKAKLIEIIQNYEHQSWNRTAGKLDYYTCTIAKFATFSIVQFKPIDKSKKNIVIKLNKKPSVYVGNIVCNAWNNYILGHNAESNEKEYFEEQKEQALRDLCANMPYTILATSF